MNSATRHTGRAGRRDFETITGWIRPRSHVLDLGCGDGSLLRHLQQTRDVTGYGIEIDDAKVLASVKNEVNVLQADLEAGLSGFDNDSVDCVILSLTLQAVRHTERIVTEMLRVGREGIVTFPNFGYWRHRLDVLMGQVPVSRELPYQWYDTPNIHFCTVADFESLCADKGIRIIEREMVGNTPRKPFLASTWPNLFATTAIYHISR